MANEKAVPITPGSGVNVDTFSISGNVRQAVVIGDPTSATGIAPVDPVLGLYVSVQSMPSGTLNFNLAQIGGTTLSGANVVDVANSAIKVNVVAGGAGGGIAELQVRNSANAWSDVGYTATGQSVPVQVQNGLTISSLPSIAISGTVTTAPTGTQTVRDTSNPPVQISGGMLQGISNSVTVLQGTSPWVVTGGATIPGNTITALGNNADNSANPTNKIPVLPARANASSPSWSEGNVVPLSTDLSGALRVSGSSGGGVAQTQVRNGANAWIDVGYAGGDLTVPVSVVNGISTNVTHIGGTALSGANVVDTGNSAFRVNIVAGGSSSIGVTAVQAATSNGLTINGTVTANQGGAPWPVTISGQPVTASITNNPDVQISGGTLTGISNTVNVTGIGAVGTPASGVVTVQGATNMVPLAVTANVVASVPNLTITSLPAISISGQPIVVRDTSNPPVQISGGTLQGISNTVTISGAVTTTPSGTQSVNVTNVSVPVQAATSNGLTVNGTVTTNQGGSWNVGVTNNPDVQVSGGTLTGISNTVTISGTVNQGTPASFANAWPVVNLNGNTISALQSGTWTVAQGTPAAITSPWPVTVVGTTITVQQATAANLNATVTGTVAATQSGNWTVTSTPSGTQSVAIVNNGDVQISGGTLTGISNTVTVGGTVTANQGGAPWSVTVSGQPVTTTVTGNPDVQISGGTLTGISNTVTISGTANQGTPASFANAWPVVNLNGNTISALQSGVWTVAQGSAPWSTTITGNPDVQISGGTLTGVSNTVTITGTVNQGTPASFANAWPVTNLNGNTITNVAAVTANSPTYAAGTSQSLSLDTQGNLRVNIVPGLTDTASLTGGQNSMTPTPMRLKAAAGTVTGWSISNVGLTNARVNVYDTLAAPTVGATVPTIRILVPSGGGSNLSLDGACFNNGIWQAAVQQTNDTSGDTSSTSPGANNVFGQIFFN